jgi:hypothetical protein
MYDWLQIARKPYFTLSEDLKLLMTLIHIPLTKHELDFFQKTIDPNGTMKKLS